MAVAPWLSGLAELRCWQHLVVDGRDRIVGQPDIDGAQALAWKVARLMPERKLDGDAIGELIEVHAVERAPMEEDLAALLVWRDEAEAALRRDACDHSSHAPSSKYRAV